MISQLARVQDHQVTHLSSLRGRWVRSANHRTAFTHYSRRPRRMRLRARSARSETRWPTTTPCVTDANACWRHPPWTNCRGLSFVPEIAARMTQKELATKLGLPEQQVQRYEAMEYDTASLSRLREVVAALGISIREEVFLPNVDVSEEAVERRLSQAGIPKGLLKRRLLGESSPKRPDQALRGLEAAEKASRVFGWAPAELVGRIGDLASPSPGRSARVQAASQYQEGDCLRTGRVLPVHCFIGA